MKYFSKIIIVLSLLFISCKDKYDLNIAYAYLVLGEELDNNIATLNTVITKKKTNPSLSLNEKHKVIDHLIVDYYNYLDGLDSISKQNKENLFYSEDVMLNQASVFKRKTIDFLEKFTNEAGVNSELILLVNDLCNIRDIKVEENFYADYIVYYYHSYPYEIFNYQIKKRKFNLKIIQSEVFSCGLLER